MENCTLLEEDETVQLCSFWMEGILMTIVGFVGVFGNLLSIYVFSNKKLSNCFNNLLIILACADIIFIVFTLLDYSFARVFHWPWEAASIYWIYLVPKLIYPLNNMSFCVSTFLTVLVAAERFLAVCRPTEYRNISITKSVSSRVIIYVVPVVLISILLNVPKFFETEFYYSNSTDLELHGKITGFKVSSLKMDATYIKYYTFLTRVLLTGILPIGFLVFFNTKIYLGIRAMQQRSKRASKVVNDQTRLIPANCTSTTPLTTVHGTPLTTTSLGTTISPETPLTAAQRTPPPTPPSILAGSRNRRTNNNINSSSLDKNKRENMKSEMNLAIVLVCIVLVFLLCHIPRLMLNVLEFMDLSTTQPTNGCEADQTVWFQCFTGFSHLLLILNSSGNFIIYCFLNNDFKGILNIKFKKTIQSFSSKVQRVPSNAVNGLELRHMKTVVLRQHPRDISPTRHTELMERGCSSVTAGSSLHVSTVDLTHYSTQSTGLAAV